MFWILLTAILTTAYGTPIRVCVPEALSSECNLMAQDLPESFSCVTSADVIGCLKIIARGDADIINVDPNALYLAGLYYDLHPITTELKNGETFTDQGIALVKKDSDIQSIEDLRNRSSCHTGLGRTVGWRVPVGRLLAARVMSADCEEGELATVQKFFDSSCVPGKWSEDPVVEKELKSKYPHLCSRCKDPATCAADDAYAGYEGVMNCVADGAADVGFTKMSALKEYLEKNPDFENQVELLCFEGGRKSIRDHQPCVWGNAPTNAFVARTGEPEDAVRYVETILQTQSRYVPKYRFTEISYPTWYYETFLSSEDVSGLKRTDADRSSYESYLGDFIHAIRKPFYGCEMHEDHHIAFCTTSDEERRRCEDLGRAAEAKGLWPNVLCVQAQTRAICMQVVQENHAQLLVLDGGDVYKAGKYHDLTPIASEVYNGSDATYYAVAVLRSASDVTKLSELKDLRSCHTGIGRTAGWVMPVGTLMSEGLLHAEETDNCNHAAAMAEFFSGGSCVPGADDAKYNKNRTRSADLCKHCVGDEEGENKCARDNKERYSGYSGALRCLAEGKGDVAFVKHLTAIDYTDGRSDLPWTKDLLSSDFQLLCDGGGTAPVSHYLHCNLGKVPAHQVVAAGNLTDNKRLVLRRFLADASKFFGEESTDPCAAHTPLFILFSPREQIPDVLFKDSATGLRIVPMEHSYEEVLGQRFLEASRTADSKNCAED